MSAATSISGAYMLLNRPSLNSEQSGCLVAVDLSCIEATELAAKILPTTAAVYARRWFYFVKSTLPDDNFADPVFDKALLEIRDVTAEFANIGAAEIEIRELLRAVGRLAAFCLAKRYCDGVVDGDDESLVRTLDDVADARVTERIIVWINYPSADV
jgi:hypothetical protein